MSTLPPSQHHRAPQYRQTTLKSHMANLVPTQPDQHRPQDHTHYQAPKRSDNVSAIVFAHSPTASSSSKPRGSDLVRLGFLLPTTISIKFAFMGATLDSNRFFPYPLHLTWLSLPLLIAIAFWPMRPRKACRDEWLHPVLAYGYIISAVLGLLYVLIYLYYRGNVVTIYDTVEFANGTVCGKVSTNSRTMCLHRASD
jgi:hypothetical protein